MMARIDDAVPGVEQGRLVLLQAGRELLLEHASEAALKALTVRAVSKRAGRSTGAFYHYWETQAEFVRDLVRSMIEPEVPIADSPLAHEFEVAATTPLSLHDFAGVWSDYIDASVADPNIRADFLLWALADDTGVHPGLGELWRTYQQTWEPLFTAMFATAGFELRDGVTMSAFAVIVQAITDGLVIRRRIDPGTVTEQLVEQTLAALMHSMFRPVGTSASFDEVLAKLSGHRPAA